MWHAMSSSQTPDFKARRTTDLQVISPGCPLPLTWELPLRDVKNEGTSGDVYENKGRDDKMSCSLHGFYIKMHELCGYRHQSVGFMGRKYQDCTLKRVVRMP
jgi:hypothetical protein